MYKKILLPLTMLSTFFASCGSEIADSKENQIVDASDSNEKPCLDLEEIEQANNDELDLIANVVDLEEEHCVKANAICHDPPEKER